MDQQLSDRKRAGQFALWVFLALAAGMALGAALMWFGVYAHSNQVQATHIRQLQGQLLQVRTELADLAAQRDTLEGTLAVETSTRKGLEATLESIQTELGAAQDQMAFFKELMPPGPEGSISIRGLDIQRKGSMLEYKALLMRRGTNATSFEGMLQFQAEGHADGVPVKVILEPVRMADADPAEQTNSDGLALQFKQFQHSSGLLQIPEGMRIQAVTLNILEGQTLRASHTVNLATLQPSD